MSCVSGVLCVLCVLCVCDSGAVHSRARERASCVVLCQRVPTAPPQFIFTTPLCLPGQINCTAPFPRAQSNCVPRLGGAVVHFRPPPMG